MLLKKYMLDQIDLEHVINLLRQEARELENPAP